jgi:hypothetical protein
MEVLILMTYPVQVAITVHSKFTTQQMRRPSLHGICIPMAVREQSLGMEVMEPETLIGLSVIKGEEVETAQRQAPFDCK